MEVLGAIGLLVVAALVVRWFVKRYRLRSLGTKLTRINRMSGQEFERYVAGLLRAQGYEVIAIGGPGDQGVDLLLMAPNKERVAVQCKNHKRPVGNSPVQEVYAGMKHHACKRACVVAPAGYTEGARKLARSTNVELFDVRHLATWASKAAA